MYILEKSMACKLHRNGINTLEQVMDSVRYDISLLEYGISYADSSIYTYLNIYEMEIYTDIISAIQKYSLGNCIQTKMFKNVGLDIKYGNLSVILEKATMRGGNVRLCRTESDYKKLKELSLDNIEELLKILILPRYFGPFNIVSEFGITTTSNFLNLNKDNILDVIYTCICDELTPQQKLYLAMEIL